MNDEKPLTRTAATVPKAASHLSPAQQRALEKSEEAEHETGPRKERLIREAKHLTHPSREHLHRH
jgi:hypothetical protein